MRGLDETDKTSGAERILSTPTPQLEILFIGPRISLHIKAITACIWLECLICYAAIDAATDDNYYNYIARHSIKVSDAYFIAICTIWIIAITSILIVVIFCIISNRPSIELTPQSLINRLLIHERIWMWPETHPFVLKKSRINYSAISTLPESTDGNIIDRLDCRTNKKISIWLNLYENGGQANGGAHIVKRLNEWRDRYGERQQLDSPSPN